jgi:phytoene dehydrogenase-like protein
VVVIGAGAGGMAVALRLAVRRHQVTVVEAADRPGGKLSGYRRDGFVFDTGPSLLTLPAVYRELFGRTGAALDDVLDLVQPEPGYGYRFADGTTVDLPSADPGRCAAALGQALGGSAEADWRALIARAGRMWQVTRRPFLESPVAGPRQLLSMVRRPSEVRTVEDPTVYVCAPDDAAMRPDAEHEAWSVLVNAPRHSTTPARGAVDWAATGLADRYRDHVLAVMAAHGFDVRDRLLWSVVRTPADLERDTGAPGGAIYGSSSNGARAAFLRPANASPIPGLFLVGGSAHPGGGLPLVGISAQIVADLVGRP